MASKISSNGTRRDTVGTQTFTRTIHVVHVDVADLLGQFDLTDEVVVMLGTPSGRDQRVAIRGNLLVPPHHADLDREPWN